MRCENCGNTGCVVVVLELTLLAVGGSLVDPDWGLLLQCPACYSTDVTGDPLALLTTRLR